MKSIVSGVFEDFKFEISEGYKKNWSFPVFALFTVSEILKFWNFKLKVLKYQWNCEPKFGETCLWQIQLGHFLKVQHKSLLLRIKKLISNLQFQSEKDLNLIHRRWWFKRAHCSWFMIQIINVMIPSIDNLFWRDFALTL